MREHFLELVSENMLVGEAMDRFRYSAMKDFYNTHAKGREELFCELAKMEMTIRDFKDVIKAIDERKGSQAEFRQKKKLLNI